MQVMPIYTFFFRLKKAQKEMEELKTLVDEELAKKVKEEEEKKEIETVKSESKDVTTGEIASDGTGKSLSC